MWTNSTVSRVATQIGPFYFLAPSCFLLRQRIDNRRKRHVTSCFSWSPWKLIRKCLQEPSWKSEAIEERDWNNKERFDRLFAYFLHLYRGKTCRILGGFKHGQMCNILLLVAENIFKLAKIFNKQYSGDVQYAFAVFSCLYQCYFSIMHILL